MKASTRLTGDEKVVWDSIRLYDNDHRGCYLAPARLARICGLRPRGLEGIRQRLVKAGLLVSERRGQRVHWWVRLPEPCWPSARPTEDEVLAFAATLDAMILPPQSTPTTGHQSTAITVGRPTAVTGDRPTPRTVGLPGRGGKGGESRVEVADVSEFFPYLQGDQEDTEPG